MSTAAKGYYLLLKLVSLTSAVFRVYIWFYSKLPKLLSRVIHHNIKLEFQKMYHYGNAAVSLFKTILGPAFNEWTDAK